MFGIGIIELIVLLIMAVVIFGIPLAVVIFVVWWVIKQRDR